MSTQNSTIKRLGVLFYGIASYGIGVAALVAWIAASLGALPYTGLGLGLEGTTAALFNLALMVGFGVQHSVMARKAFKERWTRLISPAMERSTFVLATGLVLGPMVALWQPMPAVIWTVDNAIAYWAIIAVALGGWTYLFMATWAFSHFELFGLRQVWQYSRNEAVTPVPFKERWMYRIDRHPIMTGALIGMWVTPHMAVDHLLFAAFGSLYIVIGVQFEERALIREWGSTYLDYRERVGSVVPSFTGRSHATRGVEQEA